MLSLELFPSPTCIRAPTNAWQEGSVKERTGIEDPVRPERVIPLGAVSRKTRRRTDTRTGQSRSLFASIFGSVAGESHRLSEMAEHLTYEGFMLSGTTQLIEQGFPPSDRVEPTVREVVRNALLESLLVHIRVLDDFLSMEAPARPDDVVAVDFLPSWEPRRCLTAEERTYVNKRVMHLTAVRGAGPAPWELDKGREVMRHFREFLRALEASDPAKAQWFRRWVQWEEASSTEGGLT